MCWSQKFAARGIPRVARDGEVIVADVAKPGRVVIFDPRTGRVNWEYFVKAGEGMLDHPFLALELPDGMDVDVFHD
jgi:outer membrane protein assembly factor BamB